ncbi:MAG: polymerase [Abditibacteriota bacterium]|nr:polymerase [Abditibacteriota bacterium]
MQNASVAQMFDEIADCLEIAGENPFKIRAYRRAAEAVATFAEPIEDAAENGMLRSIEGLGEATAAKVQEFLATGKVRFLEKLREEYPPTLLELLRVPNLGPKRIAQLYRERGISSIELLKEALDADQLQGIAGFGPKTLSNLKSGLERLAEVSQRLPLSDALRLVGDIQSTLKRCDAIQELEVAGSLRRGADTVGDINLLAQTDDAAAVITFFTQMSLVLSIGECSHEAASVTVRPGVTVRLFCAPQSTFGAALLFATGSAAHLQGVRNRAAALDVELSPSGFKKGTVELAAQSESEVYAALEVPYIVPELREGRGEWEAAFEAVLPTLIETSDLLGDLHSHSTWSDGSVSIRQMALAMRERGYRYFAVTDHSKALAMANGLNAARLREQAIEIALVQQEFPDIKILRGIECDILRDGSLDLDDEILHELDIVVASVHSAFNLEEAAQTERMIKAISHPAVDIVAHPTGRILGGRPGYRVDVSALIEAARETHTALEINSSERLDLDDINARRARDRDVLLAIDSDAHSTRMLPNVALGVLTARRAWCSKRHVLNAKPVDELMAWLQRPQSQA